MEWLTFSGRSGNKLIAQSENRKDLEEAIVKFLREHNYVSRYWRIARNDKCVWIDVGSHSEFFYIFNNETTLNEFLAEKDPILYRI